jgi:pimeloyl-ACP methyl ester carboxylesterase
MKPRNVIWLVAGVRCVAEASQQGIDAFVWADVEPTTDLRYHSCYEEFQCARLRVPLDWQDPDNPGTVDIAIMKLPATVPEDDPSFGGTIISNPGGPGGSGITYLLAEGHLLRTLIDRNKHYEHLSFDPRGVLFTQPSVDCFDDPLSRDALLLERRGLGELDTSYDALKRSFAMTRAFGRLCNETDQTADVLRYVSTASVARDMVEIVDRVDELRRKMVPSAGAIDRDSAQHPINEGDEPEETEKKGVARIQFIGFSYGTVLGNAFASMFPGRVGRLVLDGVDDAYDYMKGVSITSPFPNPKEQD